MLGLLCHSSRCDFPVRAYLDCRALLTGGGLHRLRDRLAWGGGTAEGFSSRIIRRGKLRAGGQHLRPAGQCRAV